MVTLSAHSNMFEAYGDRGPKGYAGRHASPSRVAKLGVAMLDAARKPRNYALPALFLGMMAAYAVGGSNAPHERSLPPQVHVNPLDKARIEAAMHPFSSAQVRQFVDTHTRQTFAGDPTVYDELKIKYDIEGEPQNVEDGPVKVETTLGANRMQIGKHGDVEISDPHAGRNYVKVEVDRNKATLDVYVPLSVLDGKPVEADRQIALTAQTVAKTAAQAGDPSGVWETTGTVPFATLSYADGAWQVNNDQAQLPPPQVSTTLIAS